MDTITAPQRVTQALRDIIDETDTLLKSAVAAGDRSVDAARSELSHRLRRLRLQVDDLQAEAVHRARQAARAADAAVHDHPYRAMGIGALAGVLLGWLVARR
ncbi:MAG TPA: hypothetical protein VMU47_18750 [Caldimonas sp.]|nr:hypothetical protein [Caldimonas sp.]